MAPRIPNVLTIGVLIPEEVQLLDLATVDLLSMLSKDYLAKAKLPSPLVKLGIPKLKIYYIAETLDTSYQGTTAGSICLTHSIDDEEVKPGKLDIIRIPGPFLPPNTTDKFKAFVQAHRDYEYTAENPGQFGKKPVFLVVCTGIFVAGNCGVLDGKDVTGPRMALFDLQIMYPAATWHWSQRWRHDGNVWTCGTVCNGLDMISAFMLENFPRALVETILFISQAPVRGVAYESTKVGAGFMRRTWWTVSIMLALLGIKIV